MTNPPVPTVDDRDLRVFLVVAEELHFARAAERLGLSGSRVSQVISRLERRVGGTLVARSSRQVRLTALGARLAELTGPAFAAIDAATRDISQLSSHLHGVFRLGIYSMMYETELEAAAAAFEAAHPHASIAVREIGFGNEDLFGHLRREIVDVLWMRLPVDEDDIVVGPVMSCEPRIALLARDHPLASRRRLTYEQLADYPLTDNPLFPKVTIDDLIPPRTASGRLITRRTTLSIPDMVRATAAGEMIHPTVPAMAPHMRHPNIVERPIPDLPHSRSALMWLRRRDADPFVRSFARIAAGVVHTCADTHR